MQDLALPAQGGTNIPAGIEKALQIIYGQWKKSKAKEFFFGKLHDDIHHIIILLSDGEHNSGPKPSSIFPTLRKTVPEDVSISVVVVGYSNHSNTSMGMLLKDSIETMSFDTKTVQTIYFANSSSALKRALSSLEGGLSEALNGSFHKIDAKKEILVENFQSGAVSEVWVHRANTASIIFLLCHAKFPPETIWVDGEEVTVSTQKERIETEALTKMIQHLIDKTKVQIVAAKNPSHLAMDCAKKVDVLVRVLEAQSMHDTDDLQLSSASPKQRVAQFRAIKTVCLGARQLRNQVIDMTNFSHRGSEESAEFLNGRNMKFANKALRRAAKNELKISDPKADQKMIIKGLVDVNYQEKLSCLMQLDALENLSLLSDDQFKNILVPIVRKSKKSHVAHLFELRQQIGKGEDIVTILQTLSPSLKDFVTSGKLWEYLNTGCHGHRSSYISLSSPWQHLDEWRQFQHQKFESTWEMLMYAGFVGYPIILERSSASQMNPFLIEVKGIRTSLIDSASICCANQSQIPVYGPEGGEILQDVLLLIDPSMPRSSKMVCNSRLLAEKYTSAVISRDLEMYSGFNMRVALHCNSIFQLLTTVEEKEKEDVIANLRRRYMGRAFMCGLCNFGPVDHVACSDLMTHHGEQRPGGRVHGRRVQVNNSCPRCGWFASDLDSWKTWDGNVCEEYIMSELDTVSKKIDSPFLEVKIDLVLRILYSFRSMATTYSKEYYIKLLDMMRDESLIDLSAKSAKVDGMSQVLIAILGPYNNEPHSNVKCVLESEMSLMSVIKEACTREAIRKFRFKAGGDKEKAKKIATLFVTKLLGVVGTSAPYTLPQMEAEPSLENVRLDCDDSFVIDNEVAKEYIGWIQGIAKKWCRIWSFARGFNKILQTREGGWNGIEKDMETGYYNYRDVIESAKEIEPESPRKMLGMDVQEVQLFFLRVGVSAIFVGVLQRPCEADDLFHDNSILHKAAREMRMDIYLGRVQNKMAEWKLSGETAVFYEARAADIVQFSQLVSMKAHAHSFDKPTFWGLWNAAKNTKNADKMAAFLSKANDEFRHKHFDEN